MIIWFTICLWFIIQDWRPCYIKINYKFQLSALSWKENQNSTSFFEDFYLHVCVSVMCVSVWWVCVCDECVWWVCVCVMSVCHMWVVLKKPGIVGVTWNWGYRKSTFWDLNWGPLKSGNALNPGSAISSSQHLWNMAMRHRRRTSSTAQLTLVPVLGPAPRVLAVCMYPGKSRGCFVAYRKRL